ncbi:MAG: acyl-CoA thioesterase [Parashewanella sp.]
MTSNHFETSYSPRFSETDGLGHISNTVIPIWFEGARDPIFELFNPTMDLNQWNLILAGFTVNFNLPTYYGKPVIIETSISKLGRSSFEVYQRCIQDGVQTAEGRTTMVHYDYENEKSIAISDSIKETIMKTCFKEQC